MKHQIKKLQLKSKAYESVLNDYLNLEEFQELSSLTLASKRITIVSFLNYLTEQKVSEIQDCLQKHVTGHLTSLAHLASATISSRTFILRHFFNYLHVHGKLPYSGNELFPVICTNKRERILSFYSMEEVRSVIGSIDLQSECGVRNLVVVLLAAELGIRSGDITRLTLDNIHWERNTIEFTQQKTGALNQLPLPEHIKYALIDYLKNHRPHTEYNTIFIGTKNGGKPLTNTAVHQIVSKYFRKAEVDISVRKHGPHALRHSLASGLLHQNAPVYVIKDILGHSNVNTTRMYLNIDLDMLRTVALEVPYEKV